MNTKTKYIKSKSPIIEKIRKRWIEIDSMAGVGIDPDIDRIPIEIWNEVGGKENLSDGIFLFNKKIVDATADFVVDFKINPNFFQGEHGRRALSDTFAYIKKYYPKILRVCDGKFADVGHTSEKIAEEIFGNLDADAVLLNPYMGFDAIEPFVKWKNKLVILCINTSNPSANDIQNIKLYNDDHLWEHILKKCMQKWNYNGNIIPILSASHPDSLKNIRDVIGDIPILLAGVGTQGGNLEESVPYCLDSNGYGLLISSSRMILFPDIKKSETFQKASRRAIQDLRKNINNVKSI